MRFTLLIGVACAWGCGPKVVGSLSNDAGMMIQEGYPPGPYGIAEGDVLPNMTFAGYVSEAPEGIVGEGEYRETVSLQDVRDLGYTYMLLNVAALWCVPCQVEAQELPEDFERWAPRGGYVLSILKEDQVFNPATKTHLDNWIGLYSTNYTMLHDPNGEVDGVLAPAALPMNLMIELETMKILRVRQGDDPEFFDFFENRL